MHLETDPRFKEVTKCWCNWNASTESEYSEFYYKCDRCGTHYAKFALKSDEIAKFYSYDQYWQQRQQSKENPVLEDRGEVLVSGGRVPQWAGLIEKHADASKGTAIEIGCAEASLLIELDKRGWNTIGIEPDPEVAQRISKQTGLEIREGVFPGVSIPDSDLIIACDVLEHVSNPKDFLAAAKNSLRDGGILFLQLPILEKKDGFAHMNHLVFDPEEHAIIYSRDSIATLLSSNGFEVLENSEAWSIAHEIVIAKKAPATDDGQPKLLANLNEIFSDEFTGFIAELNAVAKPLGLREFLNWSKIWEYPRIWHDGVSSLDFHGMNIVDIGSEQSPWPWFLASKGANVTLIETAENWTEQWTAVRDALKVNVDWKIVDSCALPIESESIDLLTSFSVLEHQDDKKLAVDEMVRVLKPNGLLGLSFDLMFDGYDMTYPEWNGSAWTVGEFEQTLLKRKDLSGGERLYYNLEDIQSFLDWHRTTAPHHNYTCGAVMLKKTQQPSLFGRLKKLFK